MDNRQEHVMGPRPRDEYVRIDKECGCEDCWYWRPIWIVERDGEEKEWYCGDGWCLRRPPVVVVLPAGEDDLTMPIETTWPRPSPHMACGEFKQAPMRADAEKTEGLK